MPGAATSANANQPDMPSLNDAACLFFGLQDASISLAVVSAKLLQTPHIGKLEHPQNSAPALPPLPPAAEVETRPALKQCIAARAASAELEHAAELSFNQGVLINALPPLEAQASSEIENIVITPDRLFQ